MTLEEAATEISRLRGLLDEREERRAKRDAEWSAMVRSICISSQDNLDEHDSVAELRECLVRTRIGASAERQCAETNSAVVDLYAVTMPDGTKAHRFVFSTPTGDLGELREIARHIAAAFYLGARDAEQVRAWMDACDGRPATEIAVSP